MKQIIKVILLDDYPNHHGGTQFYVNASTGNDTTGDGTSATPWATITKAVATVPDELCTINVADGTYAENTSGLNYLYLTRAFTERCTIRGQSRTGTILTDNTSGSYVVRIGGAQNVTLERMTIQHSASGNQGVFGAATTGGGGSGLIVSNCDLKGWTFGLNLTGLIPLEITFQNCAVTRHTSSATTFRAFRAAAGDGSDYTIRLINCTGVGQGAVACVDFAKSHANGLITSTITGGNYTHATNRGVSLHGGTHTLNGVTMSSTSNVGLAFGTDGAETYLTAGSVQNCTISSGSSHACLIGGGADNVIVSGNDITGGDYGLVLKLCDGVEAYNNTINDGTSAALYIKGATNANVHDNDISNDSAYVAYFGYDDATVTLFSVASFDNNSLVATNTADALRWGDDTQDVGGGICDSNTYDISDTTGNLGDVRAATNIANLAALQAAWSDYDVTTNDANSVVIV